MAAHPHFFLDLFSPIGLAIAVRVGEAELRGPFVVCRLECGSEGSEAAATFPISMADGFEAWNLPAVRNHSCEGRVGVYAGGEEDEEEEEERKHPNQRIMGFDTKGEDSTSISREEIAL